MQFFSAIHGLANTCLADANYKVRLVCTFGRVLVSILVTDYVDPIDNLISRPVSMPRYPSVDGRILRLSVPVK